MNLPPFSEIKASLLSWVALLAQAKQIVEGDDTVIVTTEGGDVPSWRRAMKLLGDQLLALYSTIQDWDGTLKEIVPEVEGQTLEADAEIYVRGLADNNGWSVTIGRGSFTSASVFSAIKSIQITVTSGSFAFADIQSIIDNPSTTSFTSKHARDHLRFVWNGDPLEEIPAISPVNYSATSGGSGAVHAPDPATTSGQLFRSTVDVQIDNLKLSQGGIIRYAGSFVELINDPFFEKNGSHKQVIIPDGNTTFTIAETDFVKNTHYHYAGSGGLTLTIEEGPWFTVGTSLKFTQHDTAPISIAHNLSNQFLAGEDGATVNPGDTLELIKVSDTQHSLKLI